ncbi:DUF5677 domain-containing protein [Mucilaginibacter angelicae]|uniref:DUF5677 domain-containing protein n=1 Tax=Mucilaginibacter angelicae TaxID=869718 RepID=A0ABV6L5E6_9SPHI
MTENPTEADALISEYFMKYPDNFYEQILLGPMTVIYSARKESGYEGWQNYSNLLIDKFAIHSLSFFHLSQGIVERKMDDTVRMGKGYDVFSVNALFRAMMETYMAFHWVFIAPNTLAEKEFRFLLWKLDGLYDKRKFELSEDVKLESADVLAHDFSETVDVSTRLIQNSFCQSLPPEELAKVFNPIKHKAIWRYELQAGSKLRQLKITELVQMITRTEAFLNLYRYSSMYTHSNYISVDKFRQMRGKMVKDEYAQPLLRQAILLTSLLIDDLCTDNHNAARAFSEQPFFVQRFIMQMSGHIRKVPIRPVR